MRHFPIYIVLCFALFLLVSCEQGKYPSAYQIEEARGRTAEHATYLYNNYSKGDCIVFLRESGELETYYVEANELFEYYQMQEWDLWEKTPEKVFEGCRMYTMLKNTTPDSNQFLSVCLENRLYGNRIVSFADVGVPCYSLNVAPFTQDADTIRITETQFGIQCVLRRGIGIYFFTDGKGHTWEYVRKITKEQTKANV